MKLQFVLTGGLLLLLLIIIPSRYGSFRLIDIPGLRSIMPITMQQFVQHVTESTQRGVAHLRDDWLPESCAIMEVNREEVEKWMPQDDEVRKSFNFYLFFIFWFSFC